MIRRWIKEQWVEHEFDWFDVVVVIVAVGLFVVLIVTFGDSTASCSITSTPNTTTTLAH